MTGIHISGCQVIKDDCIPRWTPLGRWGGVAVEGGRDVLVNPSNPDPV